VYQWELDGPALQEFGDLPPHARQALAAFMDAVVIVDRGSRTSARSCATAS